MNKLPETIKDEEDLKEYLKNSDIDSYNQELILEVFQLGYHRALVNAELIVDDDYEDDNCDE